MQIDREAILQAKEKLGDRNAQIIVEELGITDFDEKNMKCCCPFHQEDHASFIYNKKAFNFRCFGSCGRSYDILDVFMYKGATYAEACKKLFELAEMPYSFGELGVKTKRHYRYPHEVPCTDKSKVYAYFEQRKISRETLDALDVRQDSEGNVVFNYYDTNDVLTMVKYKPSHKVQHGQAKCWCQQNSDTAPLLFNMNRIPIGFNRGSCGGSRVAYVTNTTDLNPETWHTVFSRFCNEDRKEIGDIDIDVSPSQRDLVYDYIINRFGQEKTAFILAIGTIKSKGCIDEICRALALRWNREHQRDEKEFRRVMAQLKDENVKIVFGDARDGFGLYFFDEAGNLLLPNRMKDIPRAELIKQFSKEYTKLKEENERIFAKNPWAGKASANIKKEFEADEAAAREKYPEVFYYYDGLLDVAISQSMHPAGIVASPITLRDNYGTFISDGKEILQIDMECVHEVSLVKYDILGLKNIEIIKDAYELLGKPYPKSHEINWNDEAVWKDMLRSPIGIFQFEGEFAFQMLRQYEPHSIFDMSLVTAALRPSGASYRDDLMQHKPHKNPSPIIDELLADNNGYLIYQEDVIKFLQQICGFSGSDADNTRRAIGRKDEERLKKALPQILEGYCEKSPQPREVAEQEAKEFLQIIQDASSYMFGYNHSVGYCMIGYLCAYLRYYHPYEFITAYLNNANGEEDVKNGNELATLYGIRIVPPRFGLSKDKYLLNTEEKVIAKGISSVKYMNADVANELYELAKAGKPESFMDLLMQLDEKTHLDTRQRDILVKIDYFAEYGNSKELLRMVDFFSFFKNGTMKKISKDKVTAELEPIIAQYATDKSKSGQPAKSYTFTDLPGLLRHLEVMVRDMHIQDFDLKSKMQTQLENLGYIDLTTNKKEDQRKLVILDIYPLRSKKTKEIWAYALQVRSIGTGKTNRWTIYSELYDRKPLQRYDTIYVPMNGWGERRGYLYLYNYDYVI